LIALRLILPQHCRLIFGLPVRDLLAAMELVAAE
jgi:hypothetical protein